MFLGSKSTVLAVIWIIKGQINFQLSNKCVFLPTLTEKIMILAFHLLVIFVYFYIKYVNIMLIYRLLAYQNMAELNAWIKTH